MKVIKKFISIICSICMIVTLIPESTQVVEAGISDNVIENSTFDSNMDGWSTWINDTDCIMTNVSEGEAKISIWWLRPEGADWHAGMESTSAYQITSGQEYTIMFDAYASYNRPIKVSYDGTFSQTLNLSTVKTTYKYTFTAGSTTSQKIKFLLGNITNGSCTTVSNDQYIYFDNVYFFQGNGNDTDVLPIIVGVNDNQDYTTEVEPKVGYSKAYTTTLYYKENEADEYATKSFAIGNKISTDGYYKLVVSDAADASIKSEVEFSIKNVNPDMSTQDKWKRKVIKTPMADSLIGAGAINVSWFNKSDFGNISKYYIYVDGVLVNTLNPTKDLVMSCEYYSVDVAEHTIYIEALYSNGTRLKSNEHKFYISKKGLGLSSDMAANVDVSNFNLGWYYNWGYTPYTSEKFSTIEYVPMLWGTGSNDGNVLANIKAQGYTQVLGYNEPELWIDQSKIPVEDCIQKWHTFSDSGLRVGSPATALCPLWSTDWFQPFMQAIYHDKTQNVDFIAIHHYWNYVQIDDEKNAALDFLELIDWTYEVYKKPIWITEFAIGDSNTPFSGYDDKAKAEVYKYMKLVLEGLNQRDHVERYAWFSFDSTSTQYGASGLFNHSTGEISELGKLYADIGNPEGYEGVYFDSYTPSGYDMSYYPEDNTLPGLYPDDSGDDNGKDDGKGEDNKNEDNNDKKTPPTVKRAKIKTAIRTKNNKKIKIKIKKVAKATGYKIQYSTKKKFKKKYTKTIKVKKRTVTLKKLKTKKKYYIRVKAYVKVDGVKYYSKKWSKVKKVKVRK